MKPLKLIITIACALCAMTVHAQKKDSVRVYTEEHPLVYEDVWDLWPYSFLNEEGEPDGFNVDVIRLLMKQLNIPYVIKMKPSNEAFNDLKNGRSDLMLGLAVGFHDEFGKYSENSVTLFTQSVVTPKGKPIEIKRFRDLANHRVIVNDSSLCHHLMTEYGWGDNAIPVEDMREAIQKVSQDEEGQIVWNTLSLKWLMQRYHIDNLELTPVNMQHGQYKFMSNDIELLKKLDQAYTALYSTDKLTPIQNKWFYPERENRQLPPWMLYTGGAVVLLMLIGVVYAVSFRVQANRLNRDNDQRNRRLALILETSSVRIWTYNVQDNIFSWRNERGQVAFNYTMEEFSQRYTPEDFEQLTTALEQLTATTRSDHEENITLTLRAKDQEGGDTDYRDYMVVLSVLNRDEHGRPTVIIGTKKDITHEQQLRRLAQERTLRYWSIFNTPLLGIIQFDSDGKLTHINAKACDMFGYVPSEIPAMHLTMSQLLTTPPAHVEHELLTVSDDAGTPLCTIAVCRDLTAVAQNTIKRQENAQRVEAVRHELLQCTANIDRVLDNCLVRMASYSPLSHMLTLRDHTDRVLYSLTQTRCMTLIDSRSGKTAMHALNDMDDRLDKQIDTSLRTTLRVRGGMQLELRFVMQPVVSPQGDISEYRGVCIDISEERDIDYKMAVQEAKIQEVEQTKSSFTKNMVQEIRTPMSTVTSYVNQISETSPSPNEDMLRKGILENADYLLHLIDNILYLSRLQAHMVEINRQYCNFANFFEEQCRTAWMKYQNPHTRYVVDNPYEELVVDIDSDNIGRAIGQIAANAAQHTQQGTVRARYEYIGRRLVISMDDSGEGIPKRALLHLNAQDSASTQDTKGLGLAICRELVSQLGGNMEITSEEGTGTTVYMMIPCHAQVIKRKKQL